MKKQTNRVLLLVGLVAMVAGCASNPNKIEAAYVSPLKYKDYDCDQIAMEMDYISARTNRLYQNLKKERNADNLQMTAGLLVFWPALFFLEGGDGPEATEYAQLKGEHEALRQQSVSKKCGVQSKSPEEIMTAAQSEEREEALEVVEVAQAKHVDEVREIAENLNCRKVVTLKEVTEDAEHWQLGCADDSVVGITCRGDTCFALK